MASVIAEARTRTDEQLSLQSGILSASCGGEMLEVRVDAADASIVYVALKTPLASGDRCEIALSYAADIPEGGLRCGLFPAAYGKRGWAHLRAGAILSHAGRL